MKLEIKEIKHRGTIDERIVIYAKEDCDIGDYLVFSTREVSPGRYSSKIKDPFWFPDKEVKKNDLIVLYTKKGESSIKVNADKTTSHFYYRNLEDPIITTTTVIFLLEGKSWTAKK